MTLWQDVVMVAVAVLVNGLLTVLFLARAARRERLEHWLGLSIVVLALPALAAAVFNAAAGRPWWSLIMPGLFVVYGVLEWLLDYVWKIPFRRTSLLGPYLLLFYAALFALIGYTFQVNRTAGFVVLGLYFLNQLAAWFSYRRVGHGA